MPDRTAARLIPRQYDWPAVVLAGAPPVDGVGSSESTTTATRIRSIFGAMVSRTNLTWPERPAEQQHPVGPDDAADDRVQRVEGELHPADAGQHGGHRPDDRHEPGDQHRGRAVPVEEALRAGHVLGLEHPRPGPVEDPRPGLATDPVADQVAGDRGQRQRDQQHRQAGQVDRRVVDGQQQAGREQQRVTGQEEPDQQATLGEQDDHQADQPVAAQQVFRRDRIGQQRGGQRMAHAAAAYGPPGRGRPRLRALSATSSQPRSRARAGESAKACGRAASAAGTATDVRALRPAGRAWRLPARAHGPVGRAWFGCAGASRRTGVTR